MFARQRPLVAIPLGLIALFLRELAAPYCAACAITALVQRRWREVGGWLAGAGLYAAYLLIALHAGQSTSTADDIAHGQSWWNIGDLTSLLGKAELNAW